MTFGSLKPSKSNCSKSFLANSSFHLGSSENKGNSLKPFSDSFKAKYFSASFRRISLSEVISNASFKESIEMPSLDFAYH